MSKMQNASIFFHLFPFFISLISYAFCRKLFYIENVISYAKKNVPRHILAPSALLSASGAR